MQKTAVEAPCEVKVPASKFVHPSSGRIRSRLGNTGQGPEDVEEIPRVPCVAFWSMGRDAHAREKLRTFRFSDQIEQYRGHPTLAIVLMGFNPRMMVSIRYRSFVDIETHQSHTQFDGAVQCWILDACLTCHDHRDRQRQPRRVHHPVSVESSVGPSEPMPPGTDRTLSIGRLERQSLQARHDRIISRGDLVFGKQHHDVAVVPSGHPFVLETRCPLSFLLDKRQIALLATGKQSQSIERSRDRIEPSGIGGILHPLG